MIVKRDNFMYGIIYLLLVVRLLEPEDGKLTDIRMNENKTSRQWLDVVSHDT